MFKKATKHQAKLRLALIGPSGSGKTYTALSIAKHLGQRIAVMDTEHGSASKYADLFSFDVVEPEKFGPKVYIETIAAAAEAGYDVLIIDSLSHAWMGKGGALEMVDQAAKKAQGNSYVGWRDVTPLHNQMIDAIVGSKIHIIATMRSKMEYVQEKDDRGKTVIRKVGMQPVQRDGLEYEFDVVADLDQDNVLFIGKTRCPTLKGESFDKAGADVATVLKGWLETGAVPADRRSTEGYTTLGARLKALGFSGEKLKQAGVIFRLTDIETMPEDQYADLIAKMEAMLKVLPAEQPAAAPAEPEPLVREAEEEDWHRNGEDGDDEEVFEEEEQAPEPEPQPVEIPAQIQALITTLKMLRKALKAAGGAPEPFTWEPSMGPDPVIKATVAARKALRAIIKSWEVELPKPLPQMDDEELFSIVRERQTASTTA